MDSVKLDDHTGFTEWNNYYNRLIQKYTWSSSGPAQANLRSDFTNSLLLFKG